MLDWGRERERFVSFGQGQCVCGRHDADTKDTGIIDELPAIVSIVIFKLPCISIGLTGLPSSRFWRLKIFFSNLHIKPSQTIAPLK